MGEGATLVCVVGLRAARECVVGGAAGVSEVSALGPSTPLAASI